MAGFKSDYWSNKILALTFGATALTPPATLYCALFTVIPTPAGTGGTEVSGGGYARVAVANNTSNFPAPTTQQSSNATVITFGTPSAPWGTIVAGGWYDSATGGNLLYAGPFSPSRVGTVGLEFFIPIGGSVISEGFC